MNTSRNSFFSFYSSLGKVPTSPGELALPSHLRARLELFLRLGIPPALVRDRTVLEVGPGTGHNAEHIASLAPRQITLADILPWVVEGVSERLKQKYPSVVFGQIHGDAATILWSDQFDLVICEGTIPFQADPPRFLTNLSRAVSLGGVLILTTVDPIGLLSEVVRRYVGLRIAPQSLDIETRVSILSEAFSTHLDSLTGMTRDREDWVLDQLIHPWSGRTLPTDTAIRCLGQNFRFSGSSPSMVSDISWYKDVPAPEEALEHVVNEYLQNAPMLLDFRTQVTRVRQELGLNLRDVCSEIFDKCQADWLGERELPAVELETLLRAVEVHPAVQCERTKLSIAATREAIRSLDLKAAEGFAEWWGRGQQHVAFIRTSDESK